MATTTNYSWTTPDDTALVKDGAAAIRSLGTAIDTTVFNNASAAIAKTIVDAKGDIIAATAADTVSRLAVGANNTVLTADSTAATGLKWAAPSGYTYAIFRDEKTSGTSAGTFTSGAWRTRDLNTSAYNNITSASLTSNQISLPAGTYLIDGFAPGIVVSIHQTRLQNITDSTTELIGQNAYAENSSNVMSYSRLSGIFTIAATKTFEFQHRSVVTGTSIGFGLATSFNTEVYASITITKVA
jgi:hypothetical protein